MRYLLLTWLLAICWASCSYRSEESLIEGRWKPIAITKNDQPFIEIAETDYLLLKPDHSFYYELIKPGKKMKGIWQLRDHNIVLTYDSLNITRTFSVSELSGYNLKFSENNTVFSYIRLKN